MKVLFVCTGNICRSPMGELLLPLFLRTTAIETDSAGTHGLINSPIDPSSAKLMEKDGIDSKTFRSKRLTPQLANESDLILCFTEHQRQEIVSIAPRTRRRTFLLTDFSNACSYTTKKDLLKSENINSRLEYIISNYSLIQGKIKTGIEIKDPYHKDFEAFAMAHDGIIHALGNIADALEPSKASHAR